MKVGGSYALVEIKLGGEIVNKGVASLAEFSRRPEISWSVMHPTAIDTNYSSGLS